MSSPSTNLPPEVAEAARDPARRFGPDGRYVLLSELGTGGAGRVFHAYDTRLGRYVALKGLYRADPSSLARFQREAALAARLRHPGIVSVHDFGEQDGQSFLVMDLVEGLPLHKAALDRRARVAALRDAARAVHFAHTQGVLHRDLKPSNLMVDGAGRAVVLDFGLAREVRADDATRSGLTLTGDVLGTPQYMAPEQAQGRRDLDARIDVYGLGATLYELLAARPPHDGATAYEILRSVVERDPPAPGADPELDKVALKAMEKDPARRYATAEAFADDLDRWLRGDPVAATRPSVTYRLKRRVRRNPWAWAGAAAALMALVGGSAVAISQAFHHHRQRQALLRYEEAQSSFHAAILALLAGGSGAEAHMASFDAKIADAKRWDPAFDRGWFERAQYLRLAGDEVKAREHLEIGLSRRPDDPLGLRERGMLRAAEYERAFRNARNEALVHRAREAYSAGEIPAPLRLDEVEQAAPELASLRESAVADLRAGTAGLEAVAPPWVVLALANLDLLQGRLDEADARLGDLEFAAAKVLRGRIAETREDWTAAEEWYNRAIQTHARWWETYEARAELRAGRGKQTAARDGRAARDSLEAALEDWNVVVEALPQRASARVGRAFTLLDISRLLADSGADPTPHIRKAIEDADAAARLEPDEGLPFVLQGLAHKDLGVWQAAHGTDPTDSLRRAIDSFDAALGSHRAPYGAYTNRGTAFQLLGDWAAQHGQDPTEAFHAAEDSFRRALAGGAPGAYALHQNLGVLYHVWAKWEMGRGIDPTDRFLRAIDALDLAIASEPQARAAWNTRGNAFAGLARWQGEHGGDPSESLARAIESHEAALAAGPRFLDAHTNLGSELVMLAEWRIDQGEDPTDELTRAIASFQAALAILPGSPLVLGNLGTAYRNLGDWKMSHGTDPTEDYRRAVESYDAVIAARPDYALTFSNRAIALYKWGHWRWLNREDPEPEFRRAIASCDEALRLNPRFDQAALNRGNVLTDLAELQRRRGEDPTATFEDALASYDRALAQNPRLWYAHYYKGTTFASLGRWEEALRAFEAAYAIVGDGYAPLRSKIDEARSHVERER